MRRVLVMGMAVLLCAFWLGSCGGGDGETGRIAFGLVLVGLPALGEDAGTYEGWAVVGGVPVSTGKFRIDDSVAPALVTNIFGTRVYGTVDGATFGPAATGLGGAFPFIVSATHFFITIEPELDFDGVPSENVVMAGPVIAARADLTFTGERDAGMPANPDLSMATGTAGLFSATGGGMDENGVWFAATPIPLQGGGLTLPVPMGNWTYEGWVEEMATGTRYSTGKFLDAGFPDLDAATSLTRGSANIGLDGPGEEFINAATLNASEVLDLVDGNWITYLTVEPCSDNSFNPSPIRILEEPIPTDAVGMTGLAAMTIEMASTFMMLPTLDATAATGMLAFTGTAPGELGAARDGFYSVWSDDGVNPPERVADFITDVAGDQVTSRDGMTVFGTRSAFSFTPATTGIPFPAVENAVEIFITIEAQPSITPSTTPSPHAILSGAMMMGMGTLSVAGTEGRGVGDFSNVEGSFITSTPTDNAVPTTTGNDGMGIWYRTLTGTPGLSLPTLPPTWRYEGWVENTMTGARWSTGRFGDVNAADEDAMTWPGRGAENTGFSSPGQDFVTADPGTAIPAGVDLGTGWMAVITLEPFPDTSLAPSSFVILDGPLPLGAGMSGPFTNRTGNFPTGTMTFEP